MKQPKFAGGINIAIKIPRAHYDTTIKFYREVLGFNLQEKDPDSSSISKSHFCEFGLCILWFDQVDNYSKADVWLEIQTDDITRAEAHLKSNGVHFRDELEALPAGLKGHWFSDPAGVIHLLHESP